MVMMVMIPAMLFAMYEKNGQPLEGRHHNIYRVCFQRPKQRRIRPQFYAVLERNQLDREVYQIVRKEKLTRAERKTDRSRHRKSEPNG